MRGCQASLPIGSVFWHSIACSRFSGCCPVSTCGPRALFTQGAGKRDFLLSECSLPRAAVRTPRICASCRNMTQCRWRAVHKCMSASCIGDGRVLCKLEHQLSTWSSTLTLPSGSGRLGASRITRFTGHRSGTRPALLIRWFSRATSQGMAICQAQPAQRTMSHMATLSKADQPWTIRQTQTSQTAGMPATKRLPHCSYGAPCVPSTCAHTAKQPAAPGHLLPGPRVSECYQLSLNCHATHPTRSVMMCIGRHTSQSPSLGFGGWP